MAALLAVGMLGLGAGLLACAAPPGGRMPGAANATTGPATAGDEAPDAPANGLADWPAGAPLQLRPRVGDSRVGREEAERLARRYLGLDPRAELGLTPAYLSDDDFPFLRPQKQAVWLAEAKDFRLPAGQGAAADSGAKPAVLSRLYLALDADTGQLVEAFTAPRRPWWRETDLIGRPHEQFFRDTRRALERPPDPPGCTVADVLAGLPGEDEQGQLVVRYALYSNLGASRQVGNLLGAELSVPLTLRRPALLTFREGVPSVKQSGPGEGTVGPVRCLLVRDAATGKPLDNESYGGERAASTR